MKIAKQLLSSAETENLYIFYLSFNMFEFLKELRIWFKNEQNHYQYLQ